MLDRDTVINNPHNVVVTRKDGKTIREVSDPRVSVSMQEEGATLTLFFDRDTGLSGDAPLLEVRLTPTNAGTFEPWQLLPKLPRHVQYARGLLARDYGDVATALQALREEGKTRRGLSDDFLRIVAGEYRTLVAEGEPHPIKTLAKLRHADKSTVSRWITAARQRGLLNAQEG